MILKEKQLRRFILGLALACAGMAATASAATLTVTSTGDTTVGAAGCSDGCSLREAIAAAATGDTIQFSSSVFNTAQTINLTASTGSGLSVNKNLTITGPGARLLTVRKNTAGQYYEAGIFTIGSGQTVRISGLTINNGNSNSLGGSLTNFGTLTIDGVAMTGDQSPESAVTNYQGTMTMLNSTVSGSRSTGIVIEGGTLTIANSTISGNTGGFGERAGGIYNMSTLNLNNVTVANNTNGGIENSGDTINVRNTIITGSTGRADIIGEFVSQGNNLISNATDGTGFTQASDKTGVAANLAALANNGGQTDTHALVADSPARNAGNSCAVTATCALNNPPVALTQDQRDAGFSRQVGGAVDIGAYELQLAPTAAAVIVGGRVSTSDGRGITNVLMSLTDSSGQVRTTKSSAGGYYSFSAVEVGSTYIITATGKRFSFSQPSQVVNVSDDTAEINFIGTSEKRLRAF